MTSLAQRPTAHRPRHQPREDRERHAGGEPSYAVGSKPADRRCTACRVAVRDRDHPVMRRGPGREAAQSVAMPSSRGILNRLLPVVRAFALIPGQVVDAVPAPRQSLDDAFDSRNRNRPGAPCHPRKETSVNAREDDRVQRGTKVMVERTVDEHAELGLRGPRMRHAQCSCLPLVGKRRGDLLKRVEAVGHRGFRIVGRSPLESVHIPRPSGSRRRCPRRARRPSPERPADPAGRSEARLPGAARGSERSRGGDPATFEGPRSIRAEPSCSDPCR